MKNTKLRVLSTSILMVVITLSLFHLPNKAAKESIIFFPIDKKAMFLSASTSISLNEGKTPTYSVDWRLKSVLNEKAYLRQDIGLLYENGRLKQKTNNWKQNVTLLESEKRIFGKDSALFEGVSFHYAELHDQVGNSITSAQIMASDGLYVIDSKFSPLYSFKVPSTNTEMEWKKVMDQLINRRLQYTKDKAVKAFHIPESQFDDIALTDLPKYNNQPLPGFTQDQTNIIIGNLWEGLYKNYFLGIKLKNGTVEDPLDSTVPIILLNKNKENLYIIFLTKTNQPILLMQKINFD
ncbi:hypothetical protein [Falsibacillus albus]|uniref:Uncharacterized protein n=1 Tax=Falsibacillus albus TaxID=2478915 RepID=A0A3L7K822_9BACI|nr:hypothetical protein [Falsibacillus albus]RLQ98231.1 hypothetical protein D9X91_02265 [Falsibacillus albus]